MWALVVSFVAVKPGHQGMGIAGALYDALLGQVRSLDAPIVTFAVPESIGERVLQRAYVRAGLKIRSFGAYASYMAAISPIPKGIEWEAFTADPAPILTNFAAITDAEPLTVWNAPDRLQLVHYSNGSAQSEIYCHPSGWK